VKRERALSSSKFLIHGRFLFSAGEDKESLLKSPSVEKLLSKDIEIIFMTDSVDEYTVQHLTEYEGKRLINASREGLKLDEGDKEKKRDEQYA
jgi:HSP90 family molecular chaperone